MPLSSRPLALPDLSWRSTLTLLALWSLLGVIAALQVASRGTATIRLPELLLLHVPHWTAWAFLAIAVSALHRWLAPAGIVGGLLVHLPLCLIVVLVHSGWVATWDIVVLGRLLPVSWVQVFLRHLQQSGTVEILGYFGILGASLAVGEARRRSAPDGPVMEESGDEALVVRQGNATVRIRRSQIRYLEAAGNYVRLYTDEGDFAARTTLSSLAEQLGTEFLRIHRSRIVSLSRVTRVESRGPWDKRVTLEPGTELRASPDGWRRISEVLGTRLDRPRLAGSRDG